MTTAKLIRICGVVGLLLVIGCGGSTPPPKGPEEAKKEAAGGGGDTSVLTAVPKAPSHTLSGEAKTDFEAALKLYRSAKQSGLKSRCGEVAAAFSKIFDSHPKVVDAKFNEGAIWQECGETARAEQAYQQLLAKHPTYGPALNNLGVMLLVKAQQSAAEGYFKRAADQKDSSGYTNLALLQRNQALTDPNVIASAIENIHRALAVDSFNIDAYGIMALVLYDHAKTRSQLEIARLICVQAIKLDSTYAPVHNVLGLILLRMGRVTQALAEFRSAVQADPNFMEAHMNIGAVTLNFRDYTSAEQSFSKVLSLSPSQKNKLEALIGLGVAYRGQRKFREAMKKYEEAQALQPSNVDVAYNMGVLLQDYTFDAANPAVGIATLHKATGYLQRYASAGKDPDKVKDAEKRMRNINEMVPMLQEQMKMSPAGAGAAESTAAPAKASTPAAAKKPRKKGK